MDEKFVLHFLDSSDMTFLCHFKLQRIDTGIHISSRQVVQDDYKVLRTSIKNHKLVRWTSKFQGANFSIISTSHLVIPYCSEQKINIL